MIGEHEVAEIVIGLPLRMSGVEGIQAEKMQAFAEEIRRTLSSLPVHLWDERLTSAQANRAAARNRDVDQAPRRGGGSDGGGADFADLDGCEERWLVVGRSWLVVGPKPSVSDLSFFR